MRRIWGSKASARSSPICMQHDLARSQKRDKSLKRIQKGRVKFLKKTEKYVSTWSFMSSILVWLVTPYMDREE